MLAMQCRAVKLPAPVTEHRFHPSRKWRFDLAWPEQMVACEIDGGTYVKGRHVRPQGFRNDCEKLNEATILGWLVLRVTSAMVEDGMALDQLERLLATTAQVGARKPSERLLGPLEG